MTVNKLNRSLNSSFSSNPVLQPETNKEEKTSLIDASEPTETNELSIYEKENPNTNEFEVGSSRDQINSFCPSQKTLFNSKEAGVRSVTSVRLENPSTQIHTHVQIFGESHPTEEARYRRRRLFEEGAQGSKRFIALEGVEANNASAIEFAVLCTLGPEFVLPSEHHLRGIESPWQYLLATSVQACHAFHQAPKYAMSQSVGTFISGMATSPLRKEIWQSLRQQPFPNTAAELVAKSIDPLAAADSQSALAALKAYKPTKASQYPEPWSQICDAFTKESITHAKNLIANDQAPNDLKSLQNEGRLEVLELALKNRRNPEVHKRFDTSLQVDWRNTGMNVALQRVFHEAKKQKVDVIAMVGKNHVDGLAESLRGAGIPVKSSIH